MKKALFYWAERKEWENLSRMSLRMQILNFMIGKPHQKYMFQMKQRQQNQHQRYQQNQRYSDIIVYGA
ncbi:hypothetical protein COW80_01795 [Candidatus Beckwithbacteria bacterium CG22_combo_CG10-13_8_21_14_all_01_47_9]|uniref:Uncharacterized protein n=4 Tax=Candidatus Beckwithiibacteriota TaxID=1752726 RepID=A0A2H0E163_9BACT|nr:MAG: hypothetical protein AUJ59_02110 [Candidatus Beckwithbacteria bacterium CG1_02_47_37]PIP88166.1 MAG: hypothetical protein COW80_01795 [Candidatus Beckwithbacteria bacterium CG22_combo_CG10-13_8_21_14_all_01_47_9]PJA21900.1 MAG: hypothetical protein COX59_03665 [Candidatus Beckwithbacteria bacterium CG_4_10_14_0_2_um_filter_47_25]PJC66492.1 MAG: hypothetical protein CO018_01670 [Candidatus Beckwithbacteria bacterium CG_4_9_14_0_2_um_filter_47_11]